MKRRNMSKSIAQKGGLMIEALAMLGLIAVVTPTMYKKSAERTMEVEDINTASTIRTVMNAANDYVGANYSTIVSEMEHSTGDAANYRKIAFEQIKNYLPYGFNMKKALYNYGDPEISIARKDNNLTAFVLFPAKANADNGIGQERTSRIASLVGSSGGFVTEKGKTARGIGGVWKLEEADYKGVFPDKAENAEEYSIVTASADTINSAVNNEVDMDKYLQRGRDAGDTDNSSLWKNTMRTDLYMGNTDITNDVYNDEEKYKDKTFSIRNVKSMIIGAEYAGDDKDLDEASNYGLYVTGNKPNTYLSGTLEAVDSDFRVLQNQLSFGRTADADGNKGDYAFTVNSKGDTYTKGSLTNDKNVYLANKYGKTDGWQNIKMGVLDDNDDDDTNYIMEAYHDDSDNRGHIILLGSGSWDSRNIATFNSYGSTVWDLGGNNIVADNDDRIVFLEDGWKRLGRNNSGEEVEAPKYSGNEPYFPMRVGANAKYEGLLAAGQIDTQKIRTASLSVGSENIDDSEKWLNVDKTGVVIRDIHREDNEDYDPWGTYASFNKNGILLRADEERHYVSDNDRGEDFGEGGKDTSEHEVQLNLRVNKDFAGGPSLSNVAELFGEHTDIRGKEMARISGQGTIIQAKSDIPDWEEDYSNGWKEETADYRDTVDPNTLVLRNDNMQAEMKDKQLTIEGRTDDDGNKDATVRTLFNKGTVDMANANLNVYTDDDTNKKQVFSVRTNAEPNTDSPSNTYSQIGDDGIQNGYDITMHGKVLITNEAGGKVAAGATDADTTKAHKLISIGGDTIQTDAGINIIQRGDTITNNHQNILTIEQGATHVRTENSNSNTGNNTNIDDGTIYIRKGFVEIHGGDVENNSNIGAFDGKGVLAASRFVANNSPYIGSNGETIPEFLNTTDYYGSSTNRYDTYMVNPAYTSVMHDIKLTTRGGARLSDVLPDFINKGIYVVNNTVEEKNSPDFEYNADNFNYTGNEYGTYFTIAQNSKLDKDLDLAGTDAWASPFLGVVPAPQCPPGYGRVITLTPASFQVGQAGKLMKTNSNANVAGAYYVVPTNASSDQIEASVNDSQVAYELVGVTGKATDRNNQEIDIDPNKVKTAKYVLTQTANSDQHPIVPLTFQQSTWLKSVVKPMIKNGYPQGWAAIMGFIYPSSLYNGAKEAANQSNLIAASTSSYWNLFPVVRGSLEGYATVYCYFDRTNSVTGDYWTGTYEEYVDSYSYMKDMNNVPSSYSKYDSNNGTYLRRLNDPNMKYDEVW